jgi:hypothetical protein
MKIGRLMPFRQGTDDRQRLYPVIVGRMMAGVIMSYCIAEEFQVNPTAVPLPESVFRHIIEKHGENKLSQIVRGAFQNVLTSKPAHRIAMMQAALPIIDSEQMHGVPCDLPEDVTKEFFEYCATMHLGADVLFVGSMLFLLEIVTPPKDLPSFDEVCGA